MFKIIAFIALTSNAYVYAGTSAEVKKSHLEDIFIWKMSDELKLNTQEEKKFTEIQKTLNKKKSEINKNIQESNRQLLMVNEKQLPQFLKKHRQMIVDYNQLSLSEFDSVRKLLGDQRFVKYLDIKSDLTNKVKSLLIGDKNLDKEITNEPKEAVGGDKPGKDLPPPQIIIEKNE